MKIDTKPSLKKSMSYESLLNLKNNNLVNIKLTCVDSCYDFNFISLNTECFALHMH